MNERKWKWWLTTSLVVNIFLVGSIAGGAYKLFASDHAPIAGALTQRGLRFAADNLSPEHKQAFRQTLRETRRDARPLITSAREARKQVRALVAAPAFDRQAVMDALDRTREADIALRKRIEKGLIDFTETLTPQERIKLAEGLTREGPFRQQLAEAKRDGKQ